MYLLLTVTLIFGSLIARPLDVGERSVAMELDQIDTSAPAPLKRPVAEIVLGGALNFYATTTDVIGMTCSGEEPSRLVSIWSEGFEFRIERDPPPDVVQTPQLRGVTVRGSDGGSSFSSWDEGATWAFDGDTLEVDAMFKTLNRPFSLSVSVAC